MSVADAFCRDLIDAMPSTGAQMLCLAVLDRYAGGTVYLPCGSKAPRRRRAARHALDNGMGDADVAAMLRKRFGVSVRTALRDVRAAKANA
jgi:hypothetical protein